MRKLIKNLALALATVMLLVLAEGCASLDVRGDAIRAINDTLKAVSSGWTLTRKENLRGERVFGDSCYMGEYSAEYTHFYGKETLFGAASMEEEDAMALTVTYALKIDAGKAKLYWMDRGEERLLCDAAAEQSVTLSLRTGANYLVIEGDDLSGSLQLTVE